MKFKRIFAGIASASLCFLMLTACASVEEKTTLSESTTSAVSEQEQTSETYTLDKLLAGAYDLEKEGAAASAGCSISLVTVEGRTASVTLSADKDCTLVVAVYDEYGEDMLDSANADVKAGDTSASVTFGNDLPETYYLRGFLVDSSDLKPLSYAYIDVISTAAPLFDNPSSDGYFAENSKVESVEKASRDNMLSEMEVISMLKARGFDEEVSYDYNSLGDIVLDGEASEISTEKHPTYTTAYFSQKGIIWRIYVIGKCMIVYAEDFETGETSTCVLAENKVITSYDVVTNRFFVNEPNADVMKIKVVDRIDSATLDALTMEEVEKL